MVLRLVRGYNRWEIWVFAPRSDSITLQPNFIANEYIYQAINNKMVRPRSQFSLKAFSLL